MADCMSAPVLHAAVQCMHYTTVQFARHTVMGSARTVNKAATVVVVPRQYSLYWVTVEAGTIDSITRTWRAHPNLCMHCCAAQTDVVLCTVVMMMWPRLYPSSLFIPYSQYYWLLRFILEMETGGGLRRNFASSSLPPSPVLMWCVQNCVFWTWLGLHFIASYMSGLVSLWSCLCHAHQRLSWSRFRKLCFARVSSVLLSINQWITNERLRGCHAVTW